MWTRFSDMHSGGYSKEDFQVCYIELPEEKAEIVFYNKFGHNPNRVTCTCCGSDYSITSEDSLTELTEYDRGNETLDEYVRNAEKRLAKFIPLEDISEDEMSGDMPVEGYVWR